MNNVNKANQSIDVLEIAFEEKKLISYIETANKHFINKNYQHAISYFSHAVNTIAGIQKKTEISQHILSNYLSCLFFLGRSYMQIKSYDGAEQYFLKVY